MTTDELRTSLLLDRKNGYCALTSTQREDMEAYAKRYSAFISTCKTEREAVCWAVSAAEKLGFKPGEIPDYKALIQKSDLRNLTDTLKNNKKVRMIHTLDDFLINEKDIAFCDQVLQDRVTWFNVGGHCGHFYLTDFQKCLLEAADGIW